MTKRKPRRGPPPEPGSEVGAIRLSAMRTKLSKVEPFAYLFGTMPDEAVAKLAKSTRQRVQQLRKARGIPAFTRYVAAQDIVKAIRRGWSRTGIARGLHVSPSRVTRIARERGVTERLLRSGREAVGRRGKRGTR